MSGGPQQGVQGGAGVAGGQWQGSSECPPEERPATRGRAAPQEVLTLLVSDWLAGTLLLLMWGFYCGSDSLKFYSAQNPSPIT